MLTLLRLNVKKIAVLTANVMGPRASVRKLSLTKEKFGLCIPKLHAYCWALACFSP